MLNADPTKGERVFLFFFFCVFSLFVCSFFVVRRFFGFLSFLGSVTQREPFRSFVVFFCFFLALSFLFFLIGWKARVLFSFLRSFCLFLRVVVFSLIR